MLDLEFLPEICPGEFYPPHIHEKVKAILHIVFGEGDIILNGRKNKYKQGNSFGITAILFVFFKAKDWIKNLFHFYKFIRADIFSDLMKKYIGIKQVKDNPIFKCNIALVVSGVHSPVKSLEQSKRILPSP